MAKHLYLMRHAKAQQGSNENDKKRELTEEGRIHAMKIGRILKDKHNPTIDKILYSSSVRTTETAQLMAEQLQLEEKSLGANEEIYEASIRVLMNLVNTLGDAYEAVMVIGHNPGMTHFLEYISGEEIDHIPTAGIAILDLDVDSWAEVGKACGKLSAFYSPKSL